MDPITQTLLFNRACPPTGAFDHWQAADLRLIGSLAAGQNLTGAVSILAELHADRKLAADPLATVSLAIADFDGPFTLDFTGAQMNQVIPDGREKMSYWLLVVAIYPSGRVDPLATRIVTLQRTNYSGTTMPPPPASVTVVLLAQIAALEAAVAALTARVEELEEGGGGNPDPDSPIDITVIDGMATFTSGGEWILGPVSPGDAGDFDDGIVVTDGIATFTDSDGDGWVIGPVSPGTAGDFDDGIVVNDGIASFTDRDGDGWVIGPVAPVP